MADYTHLTRSRFKITKENIVIANLSLPFVILAVIISPHLMIIAALLVAALGYQFSFDKHSCSTTESAPYTND